MSLSMDNKSLSLSALIPHSLENNLFKWFFFLHTVLEMRIVISGYTSVLQLQGRWEELESRRT